MIVLINKKSGIRNCFKKLHTFSGTQSKSLSKFKLKKLSEAKLFCISNIKFAFGM